MDTADRRLVLEMEYAEEIQLATVLYFLQPVLETYRTECRNGRHYAYITVIS